MTRPEYEPDVAWVLKPVHVPGLPARIEIHTGSGLGLGRSPENDLVLDAELFSQVSAHHARFSVEDGALVLEDLGSLNGTYANGKRLDKEVVRPGDVIQLGRGGPKFVVAHADDLAETRVHELRTRPSSRATTSLGQSTVIRVKRALGLSPDDDVVEMVRTTERRYRKILVLTVAALLVVAAGAFYYLEGQSQKDLDRLEQINAALAQEITSTRGDFDRQAQAWQDHRAALERARADLEQRIHRVEADEKTSFGELERLREQLERTNDDLQMFDPVNLEQAKLDGVRRVRETVVFIEAKVVLRDTKTKKLLHVDRSGGGSKVNLTDTGELFASESSGSGFVVSKDGLIITNAHVVEPEDYEDPIPMRDGSLLVPEVLLSVMFDDDVKHHEATVVKAVHEGDDDLALIKIEPFEGMPFLLDFSIEQPPPATGSEVFLFGFPLGTMAIQAEDRMVGSTFKGILSRVVTTRLQVDAAVHPGNSGGPVTDAAGRVIGVVSAVQRMPEGQYAPDIGYVIPIAAAAKIWPPAPVVEASADKSSAQPAVEPTAPPTAQPK